MGGKGKLGYRNGGKRTGKPDALIYALRVEDNPTLARFRRQCPRQAAYLASRSLKPSSEVLVAHQSYYLGNSASALPSKLKHLVIPARDASVPPMRTLPHWTLISGYGSARGSMASPIPNRRYGPEGAAAGGVSTGLIGLSEQGAGLF